MLDKILDIKKYLEEEIQNPVCELEFSNNFELLIAVILSAQTTDKKVNTVTRVLFSICKNAIDLMNLEIKRLETILKPLGIYKQKAKYLKELAYSLYHNYNSIVPDDKQALMSLPGVGEKTASVVLAVGFNIPEFAVDTHVYRIAYRLGLREENDTPTQTSKKLKSIFSKEDWISMHHRFILFGRKRCKSQNPNCLDCKLKKYCLYSS